MTATAAINTIDAITAPSAWQRIDFASDLHLQASTPKTALAWHNYLAQASCDALFILGDFFEVWVGDDVLQSAASGALSQADLDNALFWQQCTAALKAASTRMTIYMAVGNRDFLLGEAFYQASGVQPLAVETVLQWQGSRYLLAHGDHWCTSDHAYQAFRSQVRAPAWQQEFLSHSLTSRLAMASNMRSQSSQRMKVLAELPDVSEAAVLASAKAHQTQQVIHGHTHTGLDHVMAGGVMRTVLSDWDCDAFASTRRAQVLSLSRKPFDDAALDTPSAYSPASRTVQRIDC